MELSIDTSTRYAGVALSEGGELLWEVRWHSRQNHTVELASSVEALLERAGARARDLAAVVVARGPGAFSALRVGMSFAKGLAEALDVPMAGVGTLEVEAAPYAAAGRPICPLLALGRGQVGWCVLQPEGSGLRQVTEEAVSGPEEAVRGAPGDAIFCGEGALALAGELGRWLGPRAVLVAAEPPTRQMSALARLGFARLQGGQAGPRESMQPRYLRPPSITLPGEAR